MHAQNVWACYTILNNLHSGLQERALMCASSSAVADRPREASCLSVVSFNSTIPRAARSLMLLVTSASDSPIRTVKLCLLSSAYTRRLIKTMSRLGVINKIHWCWHFVVRLRDTQTPPLSVITLLDALAITAQPDIGQKSTFFHQLGGGVPVWILP